MVIVFALGSTDRIFYRLGISYTAQIHVWRAGIWIIPIVVFVIARSACRVVRVRVAATRRRPAKSGSRL